MCNLNCLLKTTDPKRMIPMIMRVDQIPDRLICHTSTSLKETVAHISRS